MKLFSLLFCLLLFVSPVQAEEKLSIIATNFPCYDLARTIAGSSTDVHMLLSPGSESHSYEPTPQDIIAIQNCDLFLYVGGESDTWVDSILLSMGSDAPRSFRLSDCVTLLTSEETASMEDHHHHDHEEACDDPEHMHEETHIHDMDEHVWTSPKNVIMMARSLGKMLGELHPAQSAAYQAAVSSYTEELQALDQEFENIVANAKRKLLVFGDRFPFRYFADAYGLEYDAAFPGCSESSEPSVRTIISLVDTVRTENIPVICYIEFSSRRTADILAEETGAKPLLFHSCHNVSTAEIEAGATYLSLMWQNTEVLKEALN